LKTRPRTACLPIPPEKRFFENQILTEATKRIPAT